jgi:trk system potassium uptake protein
MRHLPWHGRVLAAFFQSVTMRTAGFNTIDFGAMHAATLMLTCGVMFIGASPGSTGGGIKTTTFAAITAEFWAELRGHSCARLLDRQLADGVVRRAMGVAFLSIGLIAIAAFVLLLTESHAPLAIFFEVVSAFSTCGLSTGITADLSATGKLVIVVVMFVGRIGPLTFALAMASEARRVPIRLATERVMIG